VQQGDDDEGEWVCETEGVGGKEFGVLIYE